MKRIFMAIFTVFLMTGLIWTEQIDAGDGLGSFVAGYSSAIRGSTLNDKEQTRENGAGNCHGAFWHLAGKGGP